MRKSILLLALCSLLFWGCDSSKNTESTTSTASQAETPATAVANTASSVKPAMEEKLEVEKVEAVAGYGKFKFEEESFDFGDIQQGDVVEHAFKFTNVGDAPLKISNIKASCGCTTPSWPREAIAPGAEGEILVKFNSRGKQGQQNKTVTISANVEGGIDRISIRTNIKVDQTANMMGPVKG